jgi:WD40 repeat protein
MPRSCQRSTTLQSAGCPARALTSACENGYRLGVMKRSYQSVARKTAGLRHVVQGSVPRLLSVLAILLAGSKAANAAAEKNAAGALRYALVHVLVRDAGYVNGMACTPDGALLAVASDDGRVTLWNTASGKLVRVLSGHKGAVYAVAISPDGAMVATGGFDETIRVWELSSGRERRALVGHQGWINAVAFTADGRTLLSAGRDRTVRVWDVGLEKMVRVIDYPSEVFTVAAGPGSGLFASDKGDSFAIREITTGSEIAAGAPGQWGINTVVFSPRRPQLITGGYDGVLWVWNIRNTKLDNRVTVEGSPVISLATTGNGSLLAALCSGNATVVLFDTDSWKELGRFKGVSYPVGSVVFSADGRILAAGGGDSPIRIWRRGNSR